MDDNVKPGSSSGEQSLQAEIARLNKIIQALMNRAERNASLQGSDFNLFQTAITLEDQVRNRTGELEEALQENEKITRALHESEDHYRAFFLGAKIPMLLIDPKDGRIVDANAASSDYYGYTLNQLRAMNIAQINTLSPAEIKQEMANVAQEKKNYFNFRHRLASGEVRDVEVHSGAVDLKDHHLLYSIVHDVTDRKRVEAVLNDLNRDFVAFLENTTDFIYFKDQDCRFRFCSQTLADITGHKSWREMTGKHDMEVFPAETARIYQEEELPIFRDGIPLLNKTDPYYDAQGRQGWVSTNKWPVFDKEGEKVIGLFGISRDITEYKRAQEEIELKNTILKTEQETSPDAILVVDENAQIISCNQHFIDLWRLPPELVNARQDVPVLQAVVEQVADPQAFLDRVQYLYGHRDEKSREEIRLADGRIIDRYSAPATGADGKYYGRVWYFHDISERKIAEEQIRNLAFNDTLTQLPNRRLLQDRMQQAMVASKRSGRYGAVMFLDLDNFKPLNDTHGHDMGDLLLIEVAQRISRCVREIDTVARFGGDEFVVMLSELDTDREFSVGQAAIVAEKIRAALAEPYLLKHRQADNTEIAVEHRCTSSIGVVLFNNIETSPDDVLRRADTAMYQAKVGGRNRVQLFDGTI